MIKNKKIQQGYNAIVSASDTGLANLGIYFCNSSTKADVIDVFVNSSGEVPSDKTKVLSQLYIPPGETFMFGNEKFILAPGESIGASSEVGDRISATVTFTDI